MSYCLSCLKEIEKSSYCKSCQRKLFNNKLPVLQFTKAKFGKIQYELTDHFSISGVQEKISLKLGKDKLIPTASSGEYILKPVPGTPVPRFQEDIPANEHLTMQIATKVFKLNTAENALIRFADGELAYLTKRFDRINNRKFRQEDFCQLSGRTPEIDGENFKYKGSYQGAGKIIQKFCAAHKIEIEKLFKLIVFNYIFGNGDAHLKNFSLIETRSGDFILSPAYDLINTSIHFPNESRTALELFDNFKTKFFQANGFYGRPDFHKLAEFFKMNLQRSERFLDSFFKQKEKVIALIERSFLSEEARAEYIRSFKDRLKAL